MLDVIFLSYNEPFADANFEHLLQSAPHAKRVNGVKGILNAHRAAAEKAMTTYFYVVDADAVIVDNFEFDYTPNKFEMYHNVAATECISCWSSKNPVNGLVYGYGGVKLFPKHRLLAVDQWTVDLATSTGMPFRPMRQVSNITAFNYDPLTAWRSAFRECAKLASGVMHGSAESQHRLNIWITQGADKPNGQYVLAGAQAGRDFGISCGSDLNKLQQINDFDWLNKKYDESNV
jgi:hypothetical protein